MKKILSFILLNLLVTGSFACDDSSGTLTSVTSNGDGTYTIVIQVCVEFLGLEPNPDEWTILFNDPLNIISAIPATVTTSTNDDYNLSINGADATWTNNGFFPSNAGVLCFTATLIVDALPTTTADVVTNVGQASVWPDCTRIITFPPIVVCSITTALGNQTPCVPATGQYTQEVIVTYANEPGSGTIDVNGQSFAITTSPQTVTLTGLTADGAAVVTTAAFSADGTCTTPINFTAPVACSACAADAGTISN
jgi:hypothetical protein